MNPAYPPWAIFLAAILAGLVNAFIAYTVIAAIERQVLQIINRRRAQRAQESH